MILSRGRPRTATIVIMAGGKGERLWPLVRTDYPKACVSLDGAQGLLQMTRRRLLPMRGSKSLIVTTSPQDKAIRRLLPGASREELLVEPTVKGTAACITLAAAILAERDPAGVMAVVPADHWIEPAKAFQQALRAAIEIASEEDSLVTIGLTPNRAHPGLGYMCPGRARGTRLGAQVFGLKRFVEKPSTRRAGELIRQEHALWNAGIFVGRVGTFVELILRWLPEHARWLLPLGRFAGTASFSRRAATAYRRVPPMSFDHGVVAHLREGTIVRGAFAWEDLGSWDSWMRVSPQVRSGVAVGGQRVRVVDADGASSRGRAGTSRRRGRRRVARGNLVVTIGLEDLMVVRTPDATLICRSEDAEAVRRVGQRLGRSRQLAGYL